jgi:butyrate kinase
MVYKILAINPGSTSTKFAIYENETEIFTETINHTDEDLAPFPLITDQLEFRLECILSRLKQLRLGISDLSAVVGRGGMLPPLHAGGYYVNDKMKEILVGGTLLPHASNLGALIADAIAAPLNIPAFIYDSVAADELKDIARITGLPEISRRSFTHVLNTKAMARKVAEKHGKKYEEMNFLVAHLGGGISINAHEKGRIVDVITDDGGPFSPQRAGSIPLTYIVDMCYSGKYDKKTISKRLRGSGGLKAHLGTSDCRIIEKMIEKGDEKAKAVYEAMAYQISKGIGELAPALWGKVDAIIITGGIANSKMLIPWIIERVKFIAPIEIMPGENEMESLSLGALRILRGEEEAREY